MLAPPAQTVRMRGGMRGRRRAGVGGHGSPLLVDDDAAALDEGAGPQARLVAGIDLVIINQPSVRPVRVLNPELDAEAVVAPAAGDLAVDGREHEAVTPP